MVTATALGALDADIDPAAVSIYVVPQPVMSIVTGFNIHRGCLAIGERPTPLDWRVLAAASARLVILERVANADNVGATFRNAAAFGVDAILLGPDCIDPLYRKAIRTSMAAALTVPFAHLSPWPGAMRELRDCGFRVIGLSPGAGSTPIRSAAAHAGPRLALVGGHEGEGLTRDALDACDIVARIPIAAGVDSLNVATAIGIGLYALAEAAEGTAPDL